MGTGQDINPKQAPSCYMSAQVQEKKQAVQRGCRTFPNPLSVSSRVSVLTICCFCCSSGAGQSVSSESQLPKIVTFRTLCLFADETVLNQSGIENNYSHLIMLT